MAPCGVGLGSKPCPGATPKAFLLAGIHGLGGAAMAFGSSGLHLDEDQQRASQGDEVELHAIGSDVASDDAIPSRFEKAGRCGLARGSEALARIRHDGAPEFRLTTRGRAG